MQSKQFLDYQKTVEAMLYGLYGLALNDTDLDDETLSKEFERETWPHQVVGELADKWELDRVDGQSALPDEMDTFNYWSGEVIA